MHAAAPEEEEHCHRCGRGFRGEWDRIPSPSGVLCNLCGRQASAVAVREDPEVLAPLPAVATVVPVATARLSTITPEKPRKKAPKPRELVIFAALTALAFVLVLVLPMEVWIAQFLAPPPLETVQALAPWQNAVVLLVEILVGIATEAFVIAALLGMTGRLPSEVLGENCLAIGVAAVLVYLVSFAPIVGFILQYLVLAWLFALDIFQVPAYIVARVLGIFGNLFFMAVFMGLLSALFL